MSEVLTVISPLNEQVLNTYAISSQAEINNALLQAKTAAAVWQLIPVKQRVEQLAKLETIILAEFDNIVDMIMKVTGKVKTEVLLGEIYSVLAALRYYKKHAATILAPCPVHTPPLLFPQASAKFEYHPFGVVAIISPWNFPFQLTVLPLLTALISGNACIIKLSELSIPIGDLIIELFAKLNLPEGLIQQVIGDGIVGKQLITAKPDLVFFTGGLNAGRAVMATAAQHPIPVILELGGKDAMIVFNDAHLERAVNAALYGAFSNSGQVCVSIERCYVEKDSYIKFVELLNTAITTIKLGEDIGALTSLKQFEIIKSHYDDAISKGAKASSPLELNGRYLKPVLLWDITHDMKIMREETFGALLPVMAFNNEQQVIELANDTEYGLNASIWSCDIKKAERIAKQLQVGNWAVNDVIKNIGHAALPFGGVKNSGFGRYHGAEGLKQFTYTVSSLTSRNSLNKEPNWFPYSDTRYDELKGFIDLLFGSGNIIQRISRNWQALQAFREYASLNLRQHTRNLLIFFTRKSP